jgi:hypothetical protein
MFRPILKLVLSVCLLSVLSIAPVKRAEADVSIVDRQLVSKKRVSRTAYEYTYTLSMLVNGPALDGAYVYVLCERAGTEITDNLVVFGDVPANAATTSSGPEGTFSP